MIHIKDRDRDFSSNSTVSSFTVPVKLTKATANVVVIAQ